MQVSEWLLFSANTAIFQLYHGKNKVIFNEMNMDLLCTRPTRLVGFYIARLLKQQSADRYVAPLGHIILIPSQPGFALSP